MRVRNPPRWLKKWGFQRTGIHVQTTTSTHVVYYRAYDHSSLQVTLGGGHLKESLYDNYFILIGSSLSKETRIGEAQNLAWRLKPSTEITSHSQLKSNKSNVLVPLNVRSSVNKLLDILVLYDLGIEGKVMTFEATDSNTRSKVCIGVSKLSVLFCCSLKERSLRSLLGRNTDINLLMRCQVDSIVHDSDGSPSYFIEPWGCHSAWRKIAGDMNHSVEFLSAEMININLHPGGLSALYECLRMFHSAVNKRPLKSRTAEMRNSSVVLSQGRTTLTIHNQLGTDVQLWITNAGFNESLDSNPYAAGGTPGVCEDDSSLNYSHQAFVLAGGTVDVVFKDPLAFESDDMSPGSDFLDSVSIDCELEGWSDVEQIRLARNGVLLYPIAPVEFHYEKSNDISVASLKEREITDNGSSPLVMWKTNGMHRDLRSKATLLRRRPAQELHDEAASGSSPYALRVVCSAKIIQRDDLELCEIKVVLSSNISLQNNSTAVVEIQSRENVEFDFFSTPVHPEETWSLPLPILREGELNFITAASGNRHENKIALVKELFDMNTPQVAQFF